ncbi:MAG: acetyl-CoA carboxylase biotin carboxyl carrier protein [Verrucomicrobiae bacterium]|nr:acetyl-CoA carboxylase biotin carboxyl carrier protein [Verrucomicrobiae bacterium]
MEIKEIKTIIDLMTRNQLSEFELEREGFKIRIKRDLEGRPVVSSMPVVQGVLPVAPMPASAAPFPQAPSSAPASLPADAIEIKSPMVGTFYRNPAPDAPPYVQVGQEVNEETVVCIIEAMKVMNEIKAEVKGVITEALVENARPVEFNTPMFRVKKSA